MVQLYLIAAIVITFDQATKAWVRQAFAPGESLPVIGNVLHLTYIQNTGAAFGILEGRLSLVILTTLVMIGAVLWYSRKIAMSELWIRLGYGLALGGAIGNLVDRIRFGWVTDFVDFQVWPVFNGADSAIFIGVCVLLWRMVIMSPRPVRGEEGEA